MDNLIDKWDLRFLKLANHVAQWSKDPSTKVGAVVVDHYRRVLGIGYNGFPRHVDDSNERYTDRPTKLDMVVHAETNAVLNSGAPVAGCTIYMTPLMPCSRCAGFLIQSGIKRIVAIQKANINLEWAFPGSASDTMLREAGVAVTIFTPEVLEHAE